MRALFLALALVLSVNSVYGWDEPLVTTRQDIARWYQYGVDIGATHLIVVCDSFSYEDFPDYVYYGHNPQKVVSKWNSQQLYYVMEVYALHLDMNAQLDEHRAWHFDAPY